MYTLATAVGTTLLENRRFSTVDFVAANIATSTEPTLTITLTRSSVFKTLKRHARAL